MTLQFSQQGMATAVPTTSPVAKSNRLLLARDDAASVHGFLRLTMTGSWVRALAGRHCPIARQEHTSALAWLTGVLLDDRK